MTSNANVIENSNSKPALVENGSSSLTAPSVGVVGTVKLEGTGKVSSVTTGITPIADPYSGLPVPTIPAPLTVPSVSLSGTNSKTLTPGVYGTISATGSAALTLSPGTYVVTKGVSIQSKAKLSAVGVSIYLACSSYPTPCRSGQAGAGVLVQNQTSVDLAPSTSSCSSPVSIFSDRNNTATVDLDVNPTDVFSGLVYAKSAKVSINLASGTSQINSTIVSGQADFLGNGSLTISGSTPPAASSVVLSGTPGPNDVGTTETVTAALTCNGQPLGNQQVNFTVKGVNPTTGTGTTNGSGSAQFTYTGKNAGADTVQAAFGSAQSNTLSVGWSSATQLSEAATTSVQGSFFAEPSGAQTFLAGPGSTVAFAQTFPTVDFNPPTKTIVGEPSSGPSPSTRPFTDVSTDINGDYAGTVVAQGNGLQAGVGSLNSFDAVFNSSFVVSKPGDVTFNVTSEDGFLFGVGNGAGRVNGTYVNAPASNTSPFNSYPLVAADDAPGSGPPTTYPVTVHFPTAGTYSYELDYFSSSGQQLSFTLGLGSFTSQTSPLSIYVGYADSTRPAASIFPFPWQGSPGVTFVGTGPFDAGAIRFDNNSTSPIPLDSVTVNIGGDVLDIWPHSSLVVPAGQILILTQDNGYNFDTSDIGPSGANWAANCTADGVIPQITVTSGGVATTYADTKQILNTQGYDTGACSSPGASPQPYIYNESEAWVNIAGGGTQINTPLPPTISLLLSPAQTGPDIVGQSQSFKVAAMDSSGNPVAGLPVTLNVNGSATGTADNQILHATTDSTGSASFSYTGVGAETDSISASAFVLGLQMVSNSSNVQWNIPVPNGPPTGGTPQEAPPAIAITSPPSGAVLSQPTSVQATITPPVSETIDSWQVIYQSTAGSSTTIPLASGTGPPPATLATFDPTLVANGSYVISLEATASGGGTQTTSLPITVLDNSKLGRYTTTYQDLSVPLNGTQIGVQRNYDSTEKSVGDFGVGWNLGLGDFRVSSNGALGAGGWSAAPSQCTLFGCTYGFNSSANHSVTVTEPGGAEEVFNYTPSGGFGPFFFVGTSGFTPQLGTKPLGTLSVYNDPGPVYDFAGNLDGGITGPIYDPTEFVFTANNGTQYLLSSSSGLLDQLSPNGNCLDIGASGVTAYTGVTATNIGGCTGGAKGQDQLSFARDVEGRITSITEPDGTTKFSYSYDSAGDLVSVTYPSGGQDAYTYDSNHDLLSSSGPGQPAQKETYDASGRLTSIVDGDGNTVNVTNNAAGNTQSFLSPDGRLATIDTYDTRGDLISQQLVAGSQTRTTSWTYDANGDVTSKTDPLGNVTANTYSSQGDITSVTDGLGNKSTLAYNNLGERISETDALGDTTTAAYNTQGELIAFGQPSGSVTNLTYGGGGNVATVTDPLNHQSKLTYDTNNNLTGFITPNGNATTLTYTSNGQLGSTTDALGHVTSYAYNADGDRTSATDPLGRTTKDTYNSLGLVATSTDADGHVTTYTYDAAGNLVQITDAAGGTVKLTYDSNNNLASLTDPDGRTRTFSYDPFGDMTSEIDPATGTTVFTYDADGRLLTSTDARGDRVTYGYDAAGNLIGKTSAAGTFTYSYDADNRMTKMVDATGTTTYAYDTDGQVTQASTPQGTLTYTYDAASRRTSMKINGSSSLGYTYDPDGNLTGLTDPGGKTTNFGYDADEHLTSVADPNGQTSVDSYDAAGQISAISSTGTGSTPLRSFTYGRDANGNVTAMSATTGSAAPVDSVYSYDALNRLTSATTAGKSTSYSYDPGGNITSVTGAQNIAYTYNLTTGLLSSVGSQTVTHDAAGEVTSVGTASFAWDALGDMTSSTSGGNATNYTYNGNGLRVGASGASTASYLWDSVQSAQQSSMSPPAVPNPQVSPTVPSLMSSATSGPSIPALTSDGTNLYLNGPAGTLGQEPVAGGAGTYYVPDALGSVSGVTNPSGALAASNDYQPYGTPVNSNGSPPAIGFTGQLQDPATSLVYLHAREFDPVISQFLSPDAVQPNGPGTTGYNQLSYAGNNPTTFTDPSGKVIYESIYDEENDILIIQEIQPPPAIIQALEEEEASGAHTATIPANASARLLEELADFYSFFGKRFTSSTF